MKKNLLFCLFLFCFSLTLLGNNGKLAYSKVVKEFVLDGKLTEWKNSEVIPIDLYFDDYENTATDCKANFRAGHYKNKIYLAIEVTDDNLVQNDSLSWSNSDAVAIFLNFGPSNAHAGVSMITLNQNRLEINSHGKQRDGINAFLSSRMFRHKYSRKKNTSVYEIEITLDKPILPYQTIGIDFYVLDIDADETGEKEIYWGPTKNVHKYYVAGGLGDMVFVPTAKLITGNVSGQLIWQDKNSKTPLPASVYIQSKEYEQFIIHARLDSTGKFNATLPKGTYHFSSAEKNTSPFDSNGYANQQRINTFDKVEFDVLEGKNTVTDTLKLNTHLPPDYLFQPTGILHNYTKADDKLINNFVENYKAYYDVPAISLALIKDDKVIFTNSYGVTNAINNSDFEPNTVFQIASITKAIFSFIVMRLVEQGVLDLDTPLYQYLPFENIAHNEGYKLITARLVLSHQTGLPNWAWGGPGGWQAGQKTDLAFLPGTKYQYSGEGYEYLGRVVTHLTSKTLEELLEDEFKTLLGINKMYFKANDQIRQARGHLGNNATLWFPPRFAGVAHSILTDSEELAKFVCELGKQEHLKKETYQEMFKPLEVVTGFEHPDSLYWNQGIGLGFFTQESPFGKAVMHGGNNGDFQGEFVYYTDAKIGFVICTNSNRGHKIGQELGRFLIYGKK
ncbi:MAG: serine hydrolase [Chitinophagales bacterium]